MTTSSTIVLADPTTYVGEATTQNYISVALLALILYEHAITSRLEIVFMWRRKFSPVMALYVLNRYGVLVYGTLAVASSLAANHEACQILARAMETTVLALILTFGICSALRVYVLWNKSLTLFLIVLGLNVAPVGLNLYLYSLIRPANTPIPFVACVSYLPLPGKVQLNVVIAARVANIVSDAIVLGVTLCKTLDTQRNAVKLHMRVPLTTALIRDGTFYFLCVLTMNIAQMVIFETRGQYYLLSFICAITAILLSRFFLDLREVATAEADDSGDVVEPNTLPPLQAAPGAVLGELPRTNWMVPVGDGFRDSNTRGLDYA